MSNSQNRNFGLRITARLILVSLAIYTLVSATTLPFDPSRGLVEIPVTINGKITGTFGLDTGADRLYLNRTFALRNDLLPKQTPANGRVAGIEGSSQAQNVALGSLKIGDEATLLNVPGTVIDLDALSQSRPGDNPDGLIGFNVLRQFYVTVDYPNKTIEMRTDFPAYLEAHPYHTIPFQPFRHLIVLDVTINDTTVPMAVDFCSSHTIISRELAARMGLTPSGDESFVRISRMALSDDVSSGDVLTAVMSFDEYRRAYPQLDIQGLLGGTFLESHVITIDYRTNHLYVPYR